MVAGTGNKRAKLTERKNDLYHAYPVDAYRY